MVQIAARPGDVLAVWSGDSFADDAIRVAEAMEGKPAVANHVIVVTHQDKLGRWIGIQGQPGGVGLTDCTWALTDSRTRSNYSQPREDNTLQLNNFLASCAKSLGIQYDWVGIAEDGLDALHATDLSDVLGRFWQWPPSGNVLPGHVVCSSLAAMLYDLGSVGWAHPDLGTERVCTPADWWNWSDKQLWQAA
jgi:hypothetical protein